MKKSVLLIPFLFFGFVGLAQVPDLTGIWKGTTNVPMGDPLITEYTLTQSGLVLEGYVFTKTQNGKDSTRIKLTGSISKHGHIKLRGIEIIYKTNFIVCLGINELTYANENGQEILHGKWRGEIGLKTCPAFSSGKIEVAKVKPTMPEVIAAETQPINQDDEQGKLLYDELTKRKYYALIIGVDQYQDNAIQDLDNPVNDARELKHVLQTFYTFEPENITLLSNPSRTQIIESFDALAQKIAEHDHVLIFYAGHGIWDERLKQGFWLPADASMTSKAQWLSNSTIRDYVGGIQSKHTLLITDACFSGGIFKERSASFGNSRAMLEMYKLPSRKAMTSGALKTVPDKSVFITYLNKNLINNDKPLISAEELFSTFKIAVINNSPNGQVPQYGPIGQVGDEGGDFIFLRRADSN
jgi:hypothetical protein